MSRSKNLVTLLMTCLVAVGLGPALAAVAPGTYAVEEGLECTGSLCLLWTAQHEGPDEQAAMRAVVLSHDGTVAYAAGGTFTWVNSTDLAVWAVDLGDGSLLWSAGYDHTQAGEKDLWLQDARHLSLSPDGSRIILSGASQGGFGFGYDIVTIAYDAATGQELWVQRENGPAGFDDRAAGVAVDSTGTYVVTVGESLDRDDIASWNLFGYELATGKRLWQQMVSSPCGEAVPFGGAAGPDGAVFVGGMTGRCLSSTTSATEASLAWTPALGALDPATGAFSWWHEDQDPLYLGQSALLRGAVHAAGDHVFLTSMISNARNPSGDLDVLTLAAHASGDILWKARYDSGGYDELKGGAVNRDGTRLYLVAHSPGLATAGVADQNKDLAVFAYDGPSGERLWTTRLDSSDQGLAGEGAVLGARQELASLIVPALFAHEERLALGYTSESTTPLVLLPPEATHRVAVLDTAQGAVVSERIEHPDWNEYAYAAHRERSDFVGVGDRGRGLFFEASVRRFTIDVTPPTLQLPLHAVAEAEGPHGAQIAYSVAAEDAGASVPVSCAPSAGTFPLGVTAVACSASDAYGNRAYGSFHVTVQDSTPPVLNAPAQVPRTATTSAGAVVTFETAATDLVGGEVPVSCSHAPGSAMPLGATIVACAAIDAAGNRAEAAFDATVTYAWSGWQGPVSAEGETVLQQGRTVPVRFHLVDESAGIEDAAASLWLIHGGVEQAAQAKDGAGNSFVFDPSSGNYTFQWATGALGTGAYQLRIDLGDGTSNLAAVTLV